MQSDNGKLFIGGISWDTNEERLKEYFSTYGEVVEAVIMKDRNTGRARGFGFVVFADPAVAEIVIQEKHNIDGRMVEAKKAVPRDDQIVLNRSSGSIHGSPGPGRTRKIFVGGLASTVTESDFKKYFDQFGTITDVVVMYDHNTQRPRGFGFITYDSEEAVDKVLLKTFHELNGKMVEVKRAVPKELSPGPTRSPLGGYHYGLSRVNSFLNGYTQGYTPSTVGGYGLRMDGRFSPVAGGRSGFPPFGSGYGMGMIEPGLNPSFGANANFNSNLSYGRGLSPYYIGNPNRYGSPLGYDGGNGGNTSFFSSVTRNLWGNGGLNYNSNSASSNAYMGSGSGTIGGNTFGNTGVNWGSSAISAQGGGNNVSNSNANFGYGSGDNSFGLGAGGYGRNPGTTLAQSSSFAASNGGYDGVFADLYGTGGGSGSVYGDPTWRSSSSERDGSGSFGYGLSSGTADVSAKNSPGFVGGYSVNKRQSNRGLMDSVVLELCYDGWWETLEDGRMEYVNANFRCIPIFVTTSPRVPSEGIEPHVDTETSFRANISGPDNEEEDVGATVFPIMTSLEQRYSPYHNNDFRDNDDLHDETEGDNHENECENNTPVNNRGNGYIPPMVRSRRRIDPLTSLALILPSNIVAPSFVSSCDSNDISVGKLFAEKNEFILQLRKVAFRDKFDFKIARSTTTRFEAHCCSESSLGSSIKDFMQYIRPVIAVDGTHLKGLYRGSMFVTTCLDAKAYGHKKFKRQLEGLWMIHLGAADYLENNVGTCNWARSQFEGRRYNILTTNIAESVNSFMREPRKFSVTHLVDHFRKTLQQWFYDRKIVVESMSTRLITWADEIVTERRTIAERMIVRPVSPHRFQVIGGGLKECLVDLKKKTYFCRVFQLDQLICSHAIAACLTRQVDFINLWSDFYTTESLAMTYAQPVEPVGDVANWEVPDEIQ
ncbi:RNA-binding (RRM/RBD/RNP motifs) family protein [Citrus sinensis]|nr:RNA-binding (RRM/RBD/RNP motifs) family protein [Citrus sinensis]